MTRLDLTRADPGWFRLWKSRPGRVRVGSDPWTTVFPTPTSLVHYTFLSKYKHKFGLDQISKKNQISFQNFFKKNLKTWYSEEKNLKSCLIYQSELAKKVSGNIHQCSMILFNLNFIILKKSLIFWKKKPEKIYLMHKLIWKNLKNKIFCW